MPLPLPSLDDRTWQDLVEEARALIPRLAPTWTDVNLSDPGVTAIDLLAYLTEAGVFALDRIPRSHRARFVDLAGLRPRPSRGAVTPVAFAARSGSVTRLPVGAVVTSTNGGRSWPHRLVASDGGPDPTTALTLWGCRLGSVQTWTGAAFLDRGGDVEHGQPFDALGDDPGTRTDGGDAALLLGFAVTPVFPADARLSLWLSLDDAATAGIVGAEPEVPADATQPGFGTVWEAYDGIAWQPVTAARDETRSLTRSGRVVLPLGAVDLPAATIGAVTDPYRWVRVRAVRGRPDVPPRVRGLLVDATAVVQAVPVATEWLLAGDAPPPPAWLTPGARVALSLHTSPDGRLREITAGADADPVAVVLPAASGSVGLTLVPAGVADGGPAFRGRIPGAPLVGGSISVWTADATGMRPWAVVDSLLRSRPGNRHVVADADSGELLFGDDAHGRCPAAGSTIIVAAEQTAGAAGTGTGSAVWSLDAIDARTRAAFAPAAPDSRDLVVTSSRHVIAGADGEELAVTEGRAADAVWAHERLRELAGPAETLDQLDRADILALPRPERAATGLDYERIALEVPGTSILRARAWAEVDPSLPALTAEGTVAVVIVPGLPAGRPQPTTATLTAVRQWLCERRTLGTRLLVTGADYVEVEVHAVLQSASGSSAARVRADALARLHAYLDPLRGGPAGRGWPFGRDVHRADLLAQLDAVAGADHVLGLELRSAGADVGCGRVCLAPLQLVVSGTHTVEVR